jgi:hypothetical protein
MSSHWALARDFPDGESKQNPSPFVGENCGFVLYVIFIPSAASGHGVVVVS